MCKFGTCISVYTTCVNCEYEQLKAALSSSGPQTYKPYDAEIHTEETELSVLKRRAMFRVIQGGKV